MGDEQKIVVEVPSDRGHYSPISIPHSNKLEEFKKGWADAIALPDNLPDLAYTLASTVAIPALLSSCWVSVPIPGFIRLGVLGVLAIAGIFTLYLRQAVPEVKDILLLRVGLVAVGILLGI
ncbi:hypothetical protein CDG76_30630 [Nostoc sp. 'Peltigera membranacea cyanobiont' 210A]|uniref:hypothetical protein n=1 Tax=Nostoc sp. 'Peltigera membranacea cyanobiont' 210A TaxID=2014529 RepID=UPI000B952720|nr:hypothetical protein [Nostoc sp. 'Peltigera membranacea cyanobiont' 210A]OYD90582.1 hypothetical protein CDG76_30630 [Nostoc sp. 'Peltigera membranacea cyanobiont' 210A]